VLLKHVMFSGQFTSEGIVLIVCSGRLQQVSNGTSSPSAMHRSRSSEPLAAASLARGDGRRWTRASLRVGATTNPSRLVVSKAANANSCDYARTPRYFTPRHSSTPPVQLRWVSHVFRKPVSYRRLLVHPSTGRAYLSLYHSNIAREKGNKASRSCS